MMTAIRPARSIRFKMGLVFGTTFFLGFTGAAGYLFSRVRAVLVEQDNRTLVERAGRLSDRTSVYPLVIPLPDRGEVMALWLISGNSRKRLYQSPRFPTDSSLLTSAAVVEADTFRLARSVRHADDGYGTLLTLVGHSSRPLHRELRSMGLLLLLTLLASILVSGLSAWWLSGWLLRPLRAIITSAQSVSRAEHTTPIPIPNSGDELQELAETINQMLTRIGQAVDTQHTFFAAASHELRTPLSILRTEIEVAQRETITDRERGFLHSQLTELRRLSRLVDDLLAMSQLRAGTLCLRPETIALDDLTLHLAERYQRTLNERHLFLAISFDETADHLTVWADLDKLTNVLLNLLDNAVKYATPGTQLDLSLNRQANQLSWTLTNQTTAPIPDPNQLSREFYQANPQHDGYGLGLWISHQVIRLMEGTLHVSGAEGRFRAEIRLQRREGMPA
ncbi:histidine kinase dimerization/phospho-acceptor domain-containing protein [Fibrella sp. WM1]|uniref:sensor histidine kinase n=1 Tax=Fibrella musci TaxID=3242485 RepID=UPI0035206D91